jgi:DNA-binding NarL/FixJ family response regulator
VVPAPHPWGGGGGARGGAGGAAAGGGAAPPARAALDLVTAHVPDLFVTEVVRDEGGDAFEVIREARERAPSVRVLVLSGTDDTDFVRSALAAGALAYVLKTADPEDVAFAVRHAFEPSIFLGGRIPAARPAPDPQRNAALRQLTKRELEILRLVAEGDSNVQLARRLWVTEQTVKFHLSNIYRKLGVSNRTEASRWAQRHGLLDPAGGEENGA